MTSGQAQTCFTKEDLLQDLFFAYRKAKADLFFEPNQRLSDLAKYEENLTDNLEKLRHHICSWRDDSKESKEFFTGGEFLGDFYFVPVGHQPPDLTKSNRSASSEPEFLAHTPSDKWDEWMGFPETNDRIACADESYDSAEDCPEQQGRAETESSKGGVTLEFRLMSNASIDMHVLSALWIWYVGDALDQQLSDGVFANRLRRNREGDYNKWSAGNFEPYTHGYKKWRNRAIEEAEKLLDSDGEALIFNTDITSFYPRIDPGFLRTEKVQQLWKNWNPNRSRAQESTEPPRSLDPRSGFHELREAINDIFISVLEAWRTRVWEKLAGKNSYEGCKIGLPLGLPASGLVANVAMHFFDQEVHEQVKPAFYGRYVDDIFIVMKGDKRLNRGNKVWEWLAERIKCLHKLPAAGGTEEADKDCPIGNEQGYRFSPAYLKTSVVRFRLDKTRIHYLRGVTGRQVLGSIEKEIEQNASEWRSLPEELDMTRIGNIRLMMTVDEDGQAARALNKARTLTASRAEFAAHLRNMSVLAETCELSTWSEHRAEFFQQAAELFAAPHMFAEFEKYYVRVLKLAVKTGDKVGMNLLLDALQQTESALRKVEGSSANGNQENKPTQPTQNSLSLVFKGFENLDLNPIAIETYRKHLLEAIEEAVASLPPTGKSAGLRSKVISQIRLILEDEPVDPHLPDDNLRLDLNNKFIRLFGMDLADVPFKQWLSPINSVSKTFGTLRDKEGNENYSADAKQWISLLDVDNRPLLMDDGHFDGIASLFLTVSIQASQPKLSTEMTSLDFKDNDKTALGVLKEISGPMDDFSNLSYKEQIQHLYPFAGRIRALALPTRPMDFADLSLGTDPGWSKLVWEAITSQEADTGETAEDSAAKDFERGKRTMPRAWTIITQGVQEQEFGKIVYDAYYQFRTHKETESKADPSILWIPNRDVPNSANGNVTIAVPSIETTDQQFRRSVLCCPDLSYGRFVELTKLINNVTALKTSKPDYLVFPELSLPKEWFLRFARTLNDAGINFIAGVEYIHHSGGYVSNESWSALMLRDTQRNVPVVKRQLKSAPAVHEEEKLRNLSGASLTPRASATDSEKAHPRIFRHGDFHFAVLICSELTDINYRAWLRGQVDAIFILEWNQDLNSFDPLVDSAALDLHCYIVQVNNRQYGDSRIRAPHSKPYERDLIRIRGGLHNHFVVGTIDVRALQQCHSVEREPNSKFKPLPAGFRARFSGTRRRAFND